MFDLALRLSGQQATDASGLFYNYRREYDPAVGRYSQSDPIGLLGGVGTFGYVSGNPVSLVDPLGMAWKPVDLGGGFTGRVDTFNYRGDASFEIHVLGPRGNEVGVYGPDGWINKHGFKGAPSGLPSGVEDQCKTISADYSRRIGVHMGRAEKRASKLKSALRGWPILGTLINEMSTPSPKRICEDAPDYPGCENM